MAGNAFRDAAAPGEWDAESMTADPDVAAAVCASRVEMYRQVNRAERVARESAEKAADDVIAALGGACLYAGLVLVLELARRKAAR